MSGETAEQDRVNALEANTQVVYTLCEMLHCDVTYLITEVGHLQKSHKSTLKALLERDEFIGRLKSLFLPPNNLFTDGMLLQFIEATFNDKAMLKERALDAEFELGELRASIEAQIAVAPRWIPVDEKLPEVEKWVLLWNGHWIGVGKYAPDEVDGSPEWQDETTEYIGPVPTHWMLLPDKPFPG